MSSNQVGLRLASPAPLSCKICGGESTLYGVSDFHRSCAELWGHKLPLVGAPVYYRRCGSCGFLFTDAFDDWGVDQFKAFIYNDDYHIVDPDYISGKRPMQNADFIKQLWGAHKSRIRVLDYGGGTDVLCAALREDGFAAAVTYDPMVPDFAARPEGKFDLVTSFETFEHLPDPHAGIAQILESIAEPGIVLFSTLTQPADFEKLGMSWWYVGPRNGHISIFTRQALAALWGRYGYKVASFNDGTHVAFRTLPSFVNFNIT